MSRFSELIDAVADQHTYSLTDVLLKAKVLSHHLSGRKFRQWVQSELNGYADNEEVPDYRVTEARVLGTFDGDFGARLSNVQLTTSHLPEDWREAFAKQHFLQSVSFIEDLVKGDGQSVGRELDGVAINYMREHGTRVRYMILNRMVKMVSPHSLIQLLTNVRSRLLDLLLEIRDKYPTLDNDDSAVAAVTGTDVDSAVERKVYQNCTIFEEVRMRDSYQAGQAGAIGPNARAENMNFVQILRDAIGQNSLADLSGELAQLRNAMLPASKNEEQDGAVSEVAQAEEAAKKGDSSGVLAHLKTAGQWAFDTATKIGATVAAKAIEKSMGM